MKKIVFSLTILLAAFACSDQDYSTPYRDYVGINVKTVSAVTFPEDNGAISVPVHYGGLKSKESITVNYTITGGTYGVDYTVEGGSSSTGTVTVTKTDQNNDAVGFIKILPVADFVIEPNVPLTVTLNSASDNITVGYPYQTTVSFVIGDDDCEYVYDNFVGTAASRENTGGDIYPTDGSSYNTEFTSTGANTVEIDNFWDWGMVLTLEYDAATRKVAVVERDWTQHGYTWNVTGTGTISTCNKLLTVSYRLKSPTFQGGWDAVTVITYQFK